MKRKSKTKRKTSDPQDGTKSGNSKSGLRFSQVQNLLANSNKKRRFSGLPLNSFTTNNIYYRSFSGDNICYSSKRINITNQDKISRDSGSAKTISEFLKSFPPSKRTQIKQAYSYWTELKLRRAQKETTLVKAYTAIAKMLRLADLDRLKEIFEEYNKCLTYPSSKLYNKKLFRLPLWEFVEWTYFQSASIATFPALNKHDSLFHTFLNSTPEQIAIDFYYSTPDSNPELSEAVAQAWKDSVGKPILASESHHLKKISARFMSFWNKYKSRVSLSGMSKSDRKKPDKVAKYLLTEFLQDKQNYKIYYLNCDGFFNDLLHFLEDNRMLLSVSEASHINQQKKLKRRKLARKELSGIKPFKPSWEK